ncbi:MAG: AzlD domain-containing protein [Rhizobacter sp.]
MSTGYAVVAIAGLAVATVVTRCFFIATERELPMPAWLRRGLRYAPLAALAAVVVPEIVMAQDHLIHTWRDARLFAVVAATAWFFWRRTMLGTIVSGMVVLVPLKLWLGW